MVVLLIIGALLIPPVLWYLGVVSFPIAVIGAVGVLLAAGWGIDRNRRPGARDPFLDANRADLAAPFSDPPTFIPTEAVESPRDRRVPD